MSARLVLTELWSTFAANGGTRLTEVRWMSCKTTNRVSGDDTLTGTIAYDETAAALVTDLTVLRLEREDATVEEWLVAEYRRTTDGLGVEVQALPARTFLSGLGVMTDVYGLTGSTAFSDTLPLTSWWYYYIDNSINSAFPSWITLGTSDNTNTSLTLSVSNTTYLQFLLDATAALTAAHSTPHYLRLVRVSSSAWEVRITTAISSSTVNLQYGHNVAKVRAVTRRVAKPTRIVPVGASATNIASGYWHLTLKAGTTLTVDGWDGVGSPIAFNDQYNGQYMQASDGTYVQITDCTAPNTFVVSSGAAFTTGDKVQFPFTSTGLPITTLTDPAATAAWTTAKTYDTPALTVWNKNAAFNQWTGAVADVWTISSGGATHADSQMTSRPNWVIGGSSAYVAMAASSTAWTYTQTFKMPSRLRTAVWTGFARVGSNNINDTFQVFITTGSGSTVTSSANTPIASTAAGAFTTASATFDNVVDSVGTWNATLAISVYNVAAAAHNVYIDYCGLMLGAAPDDALGSGPARLVTSGNADLTANRTPARYEADIIDRARNDYATYAHELLILGASGRLVVPASEVTGWAIDSSILIVEIARDELHPLSTTVQLAETAGLLSDA